MVNFFENYKVNVEVRVLICDAPEKSFIFIHSTLKDILKKYLVWDTLHIYEAFSKQLDDCIRWIRAEAKNYDRFTGVMIEITKKHILRGYRKKYITG